MAYKGKQPQRNYPRDSKRRRKGLELDPKCPRTVAPDAIDRWPPHNVEDVPIQEGSVRWETTFGLNR